MQCASPAGLHRMAYREWGDPRNREVLVCVHGLTRSARDFDELARARCAHFRGVCTHVARRGDSDRLADPKLYTWAQYVADMVTLIARLDVETVNWLGTSMGGLVGMALAALNGSPVRKLILNDAAPVIARSALERIGSYVGAAPMFASLDEAEKYVRTIAAPFGEHSDAQWRTLAETWVRRNDDGTWRPHYDLRIAEAYRATLPEKDLELWPLYDAVRCPTLLIRGERSDVVGRATPPRLAPPGPPTKRVGVRGGGPAPTLLHADQIALVRDFLLQGEPS